MAWQQRRLRRPPLTHSPPRLQCQRLLPLPLHAPDQWSQTALPPPHRSCPASCRPRAEEAPRMYRQRSPRRSAPRLPRRHSRSRWSARGTAGQRATPSSRPAPVAKAQTSAVHSGRGTLQSSGSWIANSRCTKPATMRWVAFSAERGAHGVLT